MDSARVLLGGRAVTIAEAAMLAPELLEALRDLADAARSACDARQHPPLTEALADADAAIAKATGQ